MIKYLVFFLNSLAAGILLVLLGTSYIPPSNMPLVPSVTLLTPVLLIINALFFLYWILGFSKKCLLSLFTLLICAPFVLSFFQFNINEKKEALTLTNTVKILDFNSHNFREIDTREIFKIKFIKIIEKEQPDILFFQETNLHHFEGVLTQYKYRKATITSDRAQGANPILSKHPIINSGSVGMDNVHIGRNALFVDVKIGKDTIRCYNLHLTSYRLTKKAEELKEKGAKTIVSRLNKVFKHQEEQVDKITAHMQSSPHPMIVCGDFNNMAFSYVYRELKKAGNLKDTFVEKGSGLGATLDFNYFPTRIDFILAPQEAKVHSHKVIKTKDWSDHYPVISSISL